MRDFVGAAMVPITDAMTAGGYSLETAKKIKQSVKDYLDTGDIKKIRIPQDAENSRPEIMQNLAAARNIIQKYGVESPSLLVSGGAGNYQVISDSKDLRLAPEELNAQAAEINKDRANGRLEPEGN